jgi:hypothetical protein
METNSFITTASETLIEAGDMIDIYSTSGQLRALVVARCSSGTELNITNTSKMDIFKYAVRHPLRYAKWLLEIPFYG